MQTWTTIDKTSWGAGPWSSEPDKAQWTDLTGLPCLAVRTPGPGHWCGYVGVPADHPMYGLDWQDDGSPVTFLVVHSGGVNYSAPCAEDEHSSEPMEQRVCHIPEPGQPDDVWWFGFHCAYGEDFAPGQLPTMRSMGMDNPLLEDFFAESAARQYRDLGYVRTQCAYLAAQLAFIGGLSPGRISCGE
jgi:hypothetical protein